MSSQKDEEKAERLKRLKFIERLILLPILAAVTVAFISFSRVEVTGRSMEPGLRDGQRLLVFKLFQTFSPLHEGDIVVIAPGAGRGRETEIIKRVVFVQPEGARAPWPETIQTPRGRYATVDLFPPDRLAEPPPPGSVVVLGDNLENSTDSRDFGPVRLREIRGKVWMR